MSFINNLPKSEVLSLGKVTPKPFAAGETLPTHTDDKDELAIVVKGAITVTIDDQTLDLNAGQAIVFPAGIAHSVTAKDESRVILVED